MSRTTSSEALADAILSQFAGPAAFIRPVAATSPEMPAKVRQDKYRPKGDQIDNALRRLCDTRAENQTFSQQEIATACGCHRRQIQLIERRAAYKFVRRLLEIDPELVHESLGDGVTFQDVLRIHHPASSSSGQSARTVSDFRWQRRARRVVKDEAPQVSSYETARILAGREGRKAYGRTMPVEELAQIRAERMRRNKEGVCNSAQN